MLRSITDHDSSFETLFAVKDAILYLQQCNYRKQKGLD